MLRQRTGCSEVGFLEMVIYLHLVKFSGGSKVIRTTLLPLRTHVHVEGVRH